MTRRASAQGWVRGFRETSVIVTVATRGGLNSLLHVTHPLRKGQTGRCCADDFSSAEHPPPPIDGRGGRRKIKKTRGGPLKVRIVQNRKNGGIMPPTPHLKTPPISPIFTADSFTLVVSREKTGNRGWFTPGELIIEEVR